VSETAECIHDLALGTCSICKPQSPPQPHISECKACGEPVMWVWSEKGKSLPIDVMPGGSDKARFRKERTERDGEKLRGIVHFVRDSELEANTRPMYACHFDTCAERAKT
jgi:hypothetical protein